LPDGAKFGKYCQKSHFCKKFANFYGNIFYAKIFAIFERPIVTMNFNKIYQLATKTLESSQ